MFKSPSSQQRSFACTAVSRSVFYSLELLTSTNDLIFVIVSLLQKSFMETRRNPRFSSLRFKTIQVR